MGEHRLHKRVVENDQVEQTQFGAAWRISRTVKVRIRVWLVHGRALWVHRPK